MSVTTEPWRKLLEERRASLKSQFKGGEKMKKEWEGAVDEYFKEQEDWVSGQGAWLGRLFYKADVNSDDKLTPEEVGGLLQDWVTNVIMRDVAQNEARRLFEKYDQNKNGALEIDEFKALGRELGVRYKCYLLAEGEIQRRIFAKRQKTEGAGAEVSTNLNMVIEDLPAEKKARLDEPGRPNETVTETLPVPAPALDDKASAAAGAGADCKKTATEASQAVPAADAAKTTAGSGST